MSAVGTAVTVERQRTTLCGWRWFSVLAGLTSAVELSAWRLIDWNSAADVESLIGFNWRLAAPYFLLTFIASPLQQLWPGTFSRWLLANRRYTGLAFASMVGWQLASILTLALRFPQRFVAFHDDSFQFIEDSIFLAIAIMTVTSFKLVNRHMSAAAWRRVHKTGIYLVAGLFTANNFFYAVYREDPVYPALTLAFGLGWSLRAAVWWRKRRNLTGWMLFWALAGVVNAAVLGAWSFFGIEGDPALQGILSLCAALGTASLLSAFLSRPLRRLVPGAASRWLHHNQGPFLLAAGLCLAWYLGLAMALLRRLPAPRTALLPLPLGVAVALGLLGLGLVPLSNGGLERWRERFGVRRIVALRAWLMLLLTILASYGVASAPVTEVTLALCASFTAAWLFQLAAFLLPTTRALPDSA